MSYYTLLTTIGQAKIANAIALNQSIDITTVKLGDGNGSAYDPVESQTTLVNEVYSTPVNNLYIDSGNADWAVIEAVIPTNVGGWTVREAGVFDDEGDMIAIAKFPPTYKPVLAEGAARDLYIKIAMEVGNAAQVTLQIDPAIVLASRQWVSDQGFSTENWVNVQELSSLNLIDNWEMLINQREASYINPIANQHTLDRWHVSAAFLGSVSKSATSTSVMSHRYALRLEASAINARGNLSVAQVIEVWKALRLYKEDAKLFFWVKSSQAGSFQVINALNDGVVKRHASLVTINAADTWEFKSLTITNPDTSPGNSDNQAGWLVEFMLGGQGLNSTDSWLASGYSDQPGNLNFIANNTDYIEITGVILKTGNSAQALQLPPALQLQSCERFYEKSYDLAVYPSAATGVGSGNISGATTSASNNYWISVPFRVQKRAVPAVVVYSPATGAANSIYNSTQAVDRPASANHISTKNFEMGQLAGIANNIADAMHGHYEADAELTSLT